MKPILPQSVHSKIRFSHPAPQEVDPATAVRELFAILKRRKWIVASVSGSVALAALFYITIAPRVYTATAFLQIDVRRNEMLGDRQVPDPSSMVASPEVDSQVEVLKSTRIATLVLRKLNLLENEEFAPSRPSFSLLSWFVAPASRSEAADELEAVEKFSRRLTIERVAATYVLKISFKARSPALAAEIANAVTDARVADQIEARYASLQSANTWLNDRIQALRQRQIESERAVAGFRAKNNLVDAGGRTVSDQQLSDLNARLTQAHALTAETFAKWKQIQSVVAAGNIEAPGLTEAIGNQSIARLHEQLGDLIRRRAATLARVGANHAAASQLANEIKQIEKLILSELRTVEGSVHNEYEIALNREIALTKGVEDAIRAGQEINKSEIQLRDLQREADVNRTLYEAFLARYATASEQQSFPVNEARIVAKAMPPLRPSEPMVGLILALAFAGGGVGGVASAIIRDRLEGGFRSRRQVRSDLGMEALSVLARCTPEMATASRRTRLGLLKPSIPEGLPETRHIVRSNSLLHITVGAVLSRFTDSLRSAQLAAESAIPATNGGRIVGVVSSVPGEGKSTIAANFAQLLASTGERTLLIDADFRHASLTEQLGPSNAPGVKEVITGLLPLSDAALYDTETGLEFLGVGDRRSPSEAAELANSKAFAQFVTAQREHYAWVVLDLPPIVPVVDACAASNILDGVILVVEWGKTPRNVVIQALENNATLRAHMIGCILNKADLERMAAYDPNMELRYYSPYYHSEQ
jgi:polysaccharide biosynthesis transport protein